MEKNTKLFSDNRSELLEPDYIYSIFLAKRIIHVQQNPACFLWLSPWFCARRALLRLVIWFVCVCWLG